MDPTAKLEYDDIRARAISRAGNDDDVQGINAGIELIRRTRGGSWPTEPVSVDFDYVDEIWHECEFREGGSFTYAVYDSRRPVPRMLLPVPDGTAHPSDQELLTYDVDVSWWVTHAVEPAQPPAQALPVRGRDPDAPALSVPVSISPPPSTRPQGGEEMAAWSPRRAYQQVRAAV